MNPNPHNYGNKTYCEEGCNKFQSNQHILDCSKQKKEECMLTYEDILTGSLQMKMKALKKFQAAEGFWRKGGAAGHHISMDTESVS